MAISLDAGYTAARRMETIRLCRQCARPLPAEASDGICPSCREPSTPPRATINISGLAAVSTPAPLPDFGDYQLIEEVARGGMGVVYKARQIALNRVVALKMILAGQFASEAAIKRFRSEAEAAAQLQHPNIVAIHEIGERGGQQFFTMDFVAGASLAAVLRNQALPIGEAARLMKTIAEAVADAHQHGIIHRDLKPANVLIDESGQPRITDFGLAKRLDRDDQFTVSGGVLGTPHYMSPEQAAGRHDIAGRPGDVFALGIILYEMMTGSVPFRGSSLTETLSLIIRDHPAPPSRANPRVPPDLETICLKCLEKQPERRYTAEALALDLGRFLNHEAISAKPAGVLQKSSRWLAGHAGIFVGLVSGLVIALIWLGYGLWTETRLLAWERDHPGAAPVHDFNEAGGDLIVRTGFRVLYFLAVISVFDRWLGRRRRERVLTGKRVPPLLLDAFSFIGLVAVALGIYLGAEGIEHWRHAAHALAGASGTRGPAESRVLEQRQLLVAIVAELLLAALAVWMGANLAVKAIGERRFAFYHSTDEERSAVSQASVEEQKAARRERRQRTLRTLASVPLLLVPHVWPWTLHDRFILCFVEAATFAVFLFASKALGPGSWRKRMLLIPLAVAAFLIPSFVPAAVRTGAFFGCISGLLAGLRYRPLRTVKISPPAG